MKMPLAAFAAALLTGCSFTPEAMSRMDNDNVCRLSESSFSGTVAAGEMSKRGLDCRPYFEAQARRGPANAAAAWSAVGGIAQDLQRQQQERRDAAMPPRAINCTSSRAGGTVFTTCN